MEGNGGPLISRAGPSSHFTRDHKLLAFLKHRSYLPRRKIIRIIQEPFNNLIMPSN